MTRAAFLSSISMILLATATLPACAQQDDANKVIAECSRPPREAIDSCLERVRVLNETNPSPQLQSLEAALSGRQARSEGYKRPPGEPDAGDAYQPYQGQQSNDQGARPYDASPDHQFDQAPPDQTEQEPAIQGAEPDDQGPPVMNQEDQAPPDLQGGPNGEGDPGADAPYSGPGDEGTEPPPPSDYPGGNPH